MLIISVMLNLYTTSGLAILAAKYFLNPLPPIAIPRVLVQKNPFGINSQVLRQRGSPANTISHQFAKSGEGLSL